MFRSIVYPEPVTAAYRPDIDGLRAIAILSVVTFHAFPAYFRGGFVGVDMFFVISGFLITSLIVKNLKSDDFSFIDFYQRRIRRIFPALVLVLTACFLFGSAVLYSGENQQLGKHILGGASFISNLMLWSENGYFDNSADTKPLLHLWSLGIEEQFYIVWPVLLWAAFKLRLNLIGLILVVGVASFILNLTEVISNSVAAFYSPQTRLWELLVGALLAESLLPSLTADQKSALSIGGGIMIAAGLLVVTSAMAFPGWWALLPTVGTAMVIAAGPSAVLNRAISSPPFVWFGLISFPLYLWHWPLLSFARIIRGSEPTLLMAFILVLISIALAWLTFKSIEIPLRRSGNANLNTLGLISAAALIGFVGYHQSYSFNREGDEVAIAQFAGPQNQWKYGFNEACKNRYPLKGSEEYGWWFCMLQRDASPTVIVLGNSKANDLFPGLANNPDFSNQNFLSIGACGPMWIDKRGPTSDATLSPCSGNRPYDEMSFINGIIEANKSIRFAILAGLTATFDASYIDALRKRVSFLEENNVQVIVFEAAVPLGYDIKACYRRPLMGASATCQIGHEARDDVRKKFEVLKAEIHRSNPSTLFYDPNSFYCGDTACNFIIDGMPMYRDQFGHLSEYASGMMSRDFSRWAALNAPRLLKSKLSSTGY